MLYIFIYTWEQGNKNSPSSKHSPKGSTLKILNAVSVPTARHEKSWLNAVAYSLIALRCFVFVGIHFVRWCFEEKGFI